MVLVQNCPFFHLLCLGNIGQENVFYDILEQWSDNSFSSPERTRMESGKPQVREVGGHAATDQ